MHRRAPTSNRQTYHERRPRRSSIARPWLTLSASRASPRDPRAAGARTKARLSSGSPFPVGVRSRSMVSPFGRCSASRRGRTRPQTPTPSRGARVSRGFGALGAPPRRGHRERLMEATLIGLVAGRFLIEREVGRGGGWASSTGPSTRSPASDGRAQGHRHPGRRRRRGGALQPRGARARGAQPPGHRARRRLRRARGELRRRPRAAPRRGLALRRDGVARRRGHRGSARARAAHARARRSRSARQVADALASAHERRDRPPRHQAVERVPRRPATRRRRACRRRLARRRDRLRQARRLRRRRRRRRAAHAHRRDRRDARVHGARAGPRRRRGRRARDIYSLGATLFEMIAGRPPHIGPTPIAILARLVTTPAPRLSEICSSTRRPRSTISSRSMLATNPERPARVGAARSRRALGAIASEPRRARPASRARRRHRPIARSAGDARS